MEVNGSGWKPVEAVCGQEAGGGSGWKPGRSRLKWLEAGGGYLWAGGIGWK